PPAPSGPLPRSPADPARHRPGEPERTRPDHVRTADHLRPPRAHPGRGRPARVLRRDRRGPHRRRRRPRGAGRLRRAGDPHRRLRRRDGRPRAERQPPAPGAGAGAGPRYGPHRRGTAGGGAAAGRRRGAARRPVDPRLGPGPQRVRPGGAQRPGVRRRRRGPAAVPAAALTGAEEFADGSEVAPGADGRRTGYLKELSAMDLVARHIPAEPVQERAGRLVELLTAMARTGLVSAHVMVFAEGIREVVELVESRGDLPIRLRFSPMVPPGASLEELREAAALQRRGGRRWHVEGVKFMIDGTVDNGTAWLE